VSCFSKNAATAYGADSTPSRKRSSTVTILSHSVTASASIQAVERNRDYFDSQKAVASDLGHGHLSEAVLPSTMGSDSTIRSKGS
jgi:hypothetical protein